MFHSGGLGIVLTGRYLVLRAEAVWSYHHLNEGSTILGLFELSLAANGAAVHCEGFRAL